jgi:hypothetical protein
MFGVFRSQADGSTAFGYRMHLDKKQYAPKKAVSLLRQQFHPAIQVFGPEHTLAEYHQP